MNVLEILTYLIPTIFFASCYNPYLDKTTPFLKEMFLGRCNSYQELSLASLNPSLSVSLNCSDTWNTFVKVFAFKDICAGKLTERDYEKLFDMIANKKKLINKAMFWSGTREVVHNFTYINNDYYTLEDTFPGYLANDFNWCGCKACSDGIGWKYCNQSCSSQILPYWDLASRSFAESASNIAYVMVNGTPKTGNTAYYRASTFGRVELPTLGSQKQVKELHVYVVTDLEKKPKEKCGKNSLAQMEKDVTKYGIKMKCIEDPRMVKDLLCAKYPHARECEDKKSEECTWKTLAIGFIVVSIVLLLVIMLILIAFTRKMQGITAIMKHSKLSEDA